MSEVSTDKKLKGKDLTQRIGSQAFSSSVTPAASIMRNSENGGYSEIILIRDNTGKQCLC